MLDRINVKAFWLICPYLADVFVRREALQCFEASSEVVSLYETVHMRFQLVVRSIVIPFHGGFLSGLVHPFDLSVQGCFGFVSLCSMPCSLQHRSDIYVIHCAVGPLR